MSTQFNSVDSREPERRRWGGHIAVLAYTVAMLSPVLCFPAAYVKATVAQMGRWLNGPMQLLYIAPLLAVVLGAVALVLGLKKGEARGRNHAVAAIVIGLLSVGTVWLQINAIGGFSPGCHRMACQDSLHRIGQALQLYADDYDGKLPSSYLCGRSKAWSPSDFTRFASRRGDWSSKSGGRNSTWPALLHSYVPGKGADFIWCPSDPNAWSNSPSARVSYYWKAAVDRAWYGGFRSMDDFAAKSDQVLAYEHNDWHFGRVNDGLADGAMITCVFLDSHIEFMVIPDSGYAKSENPPGPLPKSGVGEPAWFNCPIGQLGFPQENRSHKRGMYWNPQQWADTY